MAALTTIATVAGLAATAATTTGSFIQASKQKKLQKEAEAEADRALADARKKLEVNFYENLAIQKEPYELEREALLSAGAQALQSGVEGSQRGAAATAGRVQLAEQAGQRKIAGAMGQDMFDLQKLAAEEESRLRDIGGALDIREVEGQQAKAQAAEAARQAQMQQAIAGVGEFVKGAGNLIPEFMPDSDTRASNKLNRQFERAGRRGDIGGDVTIGEFGNINPVTSYAPGYDPALAQSYGDFYANDFASVSYGQNPLDFFSGMTPFEQRQYFKNRK